jgi:aspartyl-tRNA(Asn)/glutamyl-tRNA(Gln) amidotransferase subunit C
MNMTRSETSAGRDPVGIGPEQIEYLEQLARIRLTEDEKLRTQRDLSKILEYIEKLNELETEGVEPLSHTVPMEPVFREDKAVNGDCRAAILRNAPEQKNGCFKVPKTVE